MSSKPKTRDELLEWLDVAKQSIFLGRDLDKHDEQTHNQIEALIQNQLEITMKDIEGWADEAWERAMNDRDFPSGHIADVMKEMVEEEFGIKVKNG